MIDTPKIISVDDHVVEPPDLWKTRLPRKYVDVGPQIIRKRLRFIGGTKGREWKEDDENGDWCDAWHYEDAVLPLMSLLAAVGLETVDIDVTTYDQLHPGSWKKAERLSDMEANHVSAAMCFPNIFRFAGQTFSERRDKDLALLCIQAYNDWLIDDWCAGDAKGRLLPVTVVPLWDAGLAATEVLRCASKGSFLVTFPENPYPLGFPSLYQPEKYWDTFFNACEETGTVINMHIGSSSRMVEVVPEAPYIVRSSQTYVNSQGSLLDFIFSGTLEAHPKLTISYSEGQAGWFPYMIERADKLWAERDDNEFGSSLPHPPSHYVPDRVFFCMFDDETALRNRDFIGVRQLTFETDYPHPDSTFPNTRAVFEKICSDAKLTNDERYGLARGNAIRGFDLARYGITR